MEINLPAISIMLIVYQVIWRSIRLPLSVLQACGGRPHFRSMGQFVLQIYWAVHITGLWGRPGYRYIEPFVLQVYRAVRITGV